MKQFLLLIICFLFFFTGFTQTMQGTIKPGSTPRTIDVYLKPSASFSQKDEAMTFALAIPATVTPAPSMGTTGAQANGTGAVTGITGLQPTFLINNLGSTSREVVVSTQTISGTSYYIYTFIFAGTAASAHSWSIGIEQRIFSIQFNGCTNNCTPNNELLVNLPNGGIQGNAYWYFQPNTLGDITNYAAPFYSNAQSTSPVNGGSSNGSALSTIGLSTAVSLPIKLSAFNTKINACNAYLNWQTANETNAAFYAIEKSMDGITFSEIGKVNATTNTQYYSYADNTTTAGTLYYRLRMTDKDGRYTYSFVTEVNVNCAGKGSAIVYPTFSRGFVNVKLPVGHEGATIRIMNAEGKQVINNESKTILRTVNLKGLVDGVYMVHVIYQGKITQTVKVFLSK